VPAQSLLPGRLTVGPEPAGVHVRTGSGAGSWLWLAAPLVPDWHGTVPCVDGPRRPDERAGEVDDEGRAGRSRWRSCTKRYGVGVFGERSDEWLLVWWMLRGPWWLRLHMIVTRWDEETILLYRVDTVVKTQLKLLRSTYSICNVYLILFPLRN
jgi:hypothetical protein